MIDPGSRRLLVVDDEEDVRVLVSRILVEAGYQVDTASDGAEALEKIEAQRPDLVVLDLMMPGLDGWGVLARLRERGEPPPVVVVTALANYEAFKRGVREGVAGYVCKPFHFAELVSVCEKVLQAGFEEPSVERDRRREPRRTLLVEVQVLSQERRPIGLGELVNLSWGGAQVEVGAPLERGERVRLAIHIPGGDPLGLEGSVQWRQPTQRGFAYGLAFTSLSDEERRQLQELLGRP